MTRYLGQQLISDGSFICIADVGVRRYNEEER